MRKPTPHSIIRNLQVGEAVILPASKKGYIRSLISHKTLEWNKIYRTRIKEDIMIVSRIK